MQGFFDGSFATDFWAGLAALKSSQINCPFCRKTPNSHDGLIKGRAASSLPEGSKPALLTKDGRPIQNGFMLLGT
ncbi:hypothetical protein X474_21545 [Dethiosulfatarculus sandiegensis]|uniref:Uncharacterized protein n=1 Tax=Dethiosulfatarculus sandiegensis TaxID=1429043 RepID=A0A0D2J8H9_9BACT|nr:hypothetical protein X474_21545 [Dethiosulfatarculus sandiegensis]